jgi:serine-type D-Ala-D-Ala carboxypeptidase (penicillin-binding protein 5/6)
VSTLQQVKKQSVVLILCLSMVLYSISLLFQPKASAAVPIDLGLQVSAAILIEASTGQVLYAQNADEALPPASMSKMMTEYLVMEAITSGKIKWEDQVTVSQYANDVIGSGQLLATGEKYSVRDLFGAMSIYSANDATVALAEFVGGGTEENFVHMMNDAAKKLGMTQSYFINSTGLSRADLGKYQPAIQGETLMSARDAASLARAIVTTHKEVLEFSKIPAKKFRERDKTPMINWNWMLEGNKDTTNFKRYAYTGLDGLKTGHTKEAGYCFTGTAERDGMRLISVVMNAKSEPERFLQTAKVLDYGFNNYEIKTVLSAKTEIESLKSVKIKKGVKTEVPVVTQEGIIYVVKKGEEPQFTTEAAQLDENTLIAPIKQGDVMGSVKVTYEGITKEVKLVATEDVEKGSWPRLFFRAIKNFFGDIFSGISGGIKNLF